MRFTIVTPVFNGMPYLPEAIASVAGQRENAEFEVEHFVMDPGSTDGSREWLQAHPEMGCRLVFEPDGGQTPALIKGFGMASGDIFGWLNGDDVLEPGALRAAYEVFRDQADVAMVSGCCLLIDGAGSIKGVMPTVPLPTLEGLLDRRLNPAQPATFFRADAYRRSAGLDPTLNLAMDTDLWLKLLQTGGRYAVLPDKVLARFRVHADAKTERLAARSAREDFHARRRAGMKLRSQAAYELIRKGYVAPTIGRYPSALWSRIRATIRWIVIGRSKS